jgi:hypothetical protein
MRVLATVLYMMLLTLCGCGGSAEESSTLGSVFNSNSTNSSTVVVKLATKGTLPQGSSIGAIIMTLKYPTTKGLTITADNILPSGEAASSKMIPNVATAGEITLGNMNGTGFGVGEFLTITFTVAAGNKPVASDFSIAPGSIKILASDNDTTDISGQLSVVVQSVTVQ